MLEFLDHHFFGSEYQVFYVDQDTDLNFANLHQENWFFKIIVIFDLDGFTLGHVFRHVDMCHVGIMHIKWKVLKLIFLGTKILKIGAKLKELWPKQWNSPDLVCEDIPSGLTNSWSEVTLLSK